MQTKKFLIGFFTGYIVAMLISYFIFGYFSWLFAISYLIGVILSVFIINVLNRKTK